MATVLVTGGSHGHYLPSGHLIYAAAGTLLAVPFDLERLTLKGTATPVLNGVLTSATGAADIAVAGNGTLVYVPGVGDGGGQLTVMSMDREGHASALPNLPLDSYRDVRFSPDGAKLALATQNDILIYDIARAALSRLTTDPAPDIAPLWTPDSQRIVFTARRAGYSELFWRRADGAGSEDRLLSGDDNLIDLNPNAWSLDGTQLLFTRVSSSTQVVASIEQLSIARPTESKVLIENDFNVGRAAVSPDGHWIAYESNRSNRPEIYVERYPEMQERQTISAGGGRLPLWGPNRKELFFTSLDGRQMFVVPVQLGATFVAGRPRVLFDSRMQPIQGGNRPADIAPNGRFVIIRNAEFDDGGPGSHLIVVQNWFEELNRLVPSK
jgi:Tol biopolymer transport system component